MDLSVIIVETNSTLKELIIKKFDENTLYKKCNLKKPDDFNKKIEWKVFIDNKKYFVTLFAKEKGRANNENKYDFPPPVDKKLFFGNCILFAKDDNNDYFDLKISFWEKIYEKLFGGFENLDETIEEDENEEDELDNVPDELKSKDGYLKDDFVVDEEIEDEDDDDDEEDSWDDDEEEQDEDDDEELDDDDDEMLDELGSELSTEMYEYSDED